MFRLSDEDGRAVDMLLDAKASGRGNGNGNGQGDGDGRDSNAHAHAATAARFPERVARVARILDLLKAIPTSDPPTDLLSRTLTHIDVAPKQQLSAQQSSHPQQQAQRPHA